MESKIERTIYALILTDFYTYKIPRVERYTSQVLRQARWKEASLGSIGKR